MKMNGSSAVVMAAVLAFGVRVSVAQAASDADKAFVAKVSQGGMYEVEAGKVAAERGMSPVVKDFGVMEAHDHEGVGAGLKKAASASGVTFSSKLNPEFAARLAKLKAVPADQFDAYYVTDMKQIHNNDEALFVKEANEGTAGYKEFAHNTAVLVKAHLGWLNTL